MPAKRRSLLGLFIGVLATCLMFIANASRASEASDGPVTMTWSLRNDFRSGAARENPNVDAQEFPTWHFLRTTGVDGPVESRRWSRDGRYVPLSEQGERLFGMPLDGWIYQAGGSALAPSIVQVTQPQDFGLKLEPGDLLLAPGLEHAIVIGWRSPVAGMMTIRGSFEHAQDCCGDNSQVNWYVERGPAPEASQGFVPVTLAAGSSDFGQPSQVGRFDLAGLAVTPGDFVYFVVDALADGTASPHAGDGTRFDVTISVSGAQHPEAPRFESDVLPILTAHCAHCHDAATREGRLSLETVASLLAGGGNGPAVIAGAPGQSLLIEKVTSGEMPPGDDRLSSEQISSLRRWIKSGISADDLGRSAASSLFTDEERGHWAFRDLTPPEVPPVEAIDQAPTTIDRFLLAGLERAGLSFSEPADRLTLLRRVTFDLTGLPPTPDEQLAFERDERGDAYERVVQRLLASPQFGVRWGRYWLDVVGYTDTVSFDEDFGPPIGFLEGKWRYRDYVIDAFNADKPYDQFVLEQLAGDELVDWRNATEYTPEIIEKLVATGFLRTVEDFSVEDPRPFVIWSTVHETVEQTGTSFLGLTLLCARCHSHKFEPIPHRDYYSLMSLFTPALDPANWKNARNRMLPDVPAPVQAEIERHNAEIDHQVAEAQATIDAVRREVDRRLREENLATMPEPIRADLRTALDLPADQQTEVQKYLAAKLGPLVQSSPAAIDAALSPEERDALQGKAQRIAELNAGRRTHGWIHAVYDVGPPPITRIHHRGEHDKLGREAPPGFLRVLSNAEADSHLTATDGSQTSGRRTALARWITATDSPASGLAARVMVNRLWQQLFGLGLAANSENLGLSGTPPSHPELLDWLAADFRAHGWSVKRAIRQIVESAAYRQSSAAGRLVSSTATSPAGVDPENTLLWRMRLRRLDAEALRDSIVWQAGKLDLGLGGPPTPLTYDLATGAVSEVALSPAMPLYRRGIYLVNRRLYNPTLLSSFDKPTVTRGLCRRENSATAVQSLNLMNDGFLFTNASRFAERVEAEAGPSQADQIELAFVLAMSRPPADEERAWCDELLVKQTELFRQAGHPADEAARKALASLCQALWGTNDFLYLR
jgi:hypothetical protein